MGLTFTIVPALFLLIFLFNPIKEKYAKKIMLYSIIICIFGTSSIYFADKIILYFLLGIMGISCVTFIIGWSYYYTKNIPVMEKMSIMALVIITGNVIFYVFNILTPILTIAESLTLAVFLLVLCFWLTKNISEAEDIYMCEPFQPVFPRTLMLIVCLFFFVINVNGGLMFQSIYPYFKIQSHFSRYYNMIPYILTLTLFYFLGKKIQKTVPIYIATSLLGLAHLSYAVWGATTQGFYVTETLAQTGWALIDVFLWGLLGEIASFYGHPFKICALGLITNLSAVCTGGLIGNLLLHNEEKSYLLTGILASAVTFASFFIVPWMNKSIEQYLKNEVNELEDRNSLSSNNIIGSLPHINDLTSRELEIIGLMFKGYSNKEITDKLFISENTLKLHSRHIYSKIGVSNKTELFYLALSLNNY
jgi:DNA-binding CsgD family transcriptional regulator